jgi:hypothetical protein
MHMRLVASPHMPLLMLIAKYVLPCCIMIGKY